MHAQKVGPSSDFLGKHLGGRPFTFPCAITFNGMSLSAHALVDTGASGYLFVSISFARRLIRHLHLPRVRNFNPQAAGGFEGQPTQLVDIALFGHFWIQSRLTAGVHFLVLDMPQDVIVGRKWMEKHDVSLDVRRRGLMFPEEWTPQRMGRHLAMDGAGALLKSPLFDQDAQEREVKMAREDKRRIDGRKSQKNPPPCYVSQDRAAEPSVAPNQIIPPRTILTRPRNCRADVNLTKMARAMREPRDGEPTPSTPTLKKTSTALERDSQGYFVRRRSSAGSFKDRIDIALISGPAMEMSYRRDPDSWRCTSLHAINKVIAEKRADALMTSDSDDLRRKTLQVVPAQYHDYLDVFSKFESDQLPPRRLCDHRITLDEGTKPEELLGYSGLRKMSLEEMEACRKYVTENLDKGFIGPTEAPWAAPILFAPKPNGGLRFCVDFRRLNSATRKDRHPLPLIEETLARISKAKIFTKLDIRQAFHRIRIAPGYENLTAFRTRYGTFQYNVVPFGLTNAPATFQRFMNETLMDYLDDFCSAYLDDIVIFSNSVEEHEEHVKKVLERLRQAGLQADTDKCEFHVQKTKFLGFIISTDGVAVDPAKTAVVRDWAPPTSVKGVQSFLGFCNFYRKFVREYGRIARPLTALTRQGLPKFDWTDECQDAFDKLKQRLLQAPVLAHFDFDKDTRVETDASDGVVAGVLSQKASDGTDDWHPVAFFSETLQGSELNYSIHDKELMAVVQALKHWRAELVGLQRPRFTILTDHGSLEYFSQKRHLNLRQAHWAELLAEYHCILSYRPGTQNAAADALSRKTEELRTQKEKSEAMRHLAIFRETGGQHVPALSPITPVSGSDAEELPRPPPALSGAILAEQVMSTKRSDPLLQTFRDKVRTETDDEAVWTLHDGILLRNDKMVVSEQDNLRIKLLDDLHSRLTSAHPGRNKLRKMMQSQYWWPGLSRDVDRFVANCLVCRSSKAPRDKTPGLLHPLPVPLRAWKHIQMDFKTMPRDRKGYDNLLVMVCLLSKRSWCIPCTQGVTAKDVAKMYYYGPYRVFGLPQQIGSDRGPQFVSHFTDELSKLLGTTWKLGSSGHSQTQGQVERMNQAIQQRILPYVNHFQDNWSSAIPALDAVQASLPQDSTNLSPHEVERGFPMPLPYLRADVANRLSGMPTTERLSRQDARQLNETLQSYTDVARKCALAAQQAMCDQANKSRRVPDFGVGDKVLILKKVWSTDQPGDVLTFPLTQQPLTIKGMKGHSYELEVPAGWKGTTVFHADRLRLFKDDPMPGQAAENPAGEIVDPDAGEEWEVDHVTSSRLYYGKLQYQVRWKGWDPDPTWYDAESFKNSASLLQHYHAQYPENAGPPARLGRWLEAAAQDRIDPPHANDNKPLTTQQTARRRGRRVR